MLYKQLCRMDRQRVAPHVVLLIELWGSRGTRFERWTYRSRPCRCVPVFLIPLAWGIRHSDLSREGNLRPGG